MQAHEECPKGRHFEKEKFIFWIWTRKKVTSNHRKMFTIEIVRTFSIESVCIRNNEFEKPLFCLVLSCLLKDSYTEIIFMKYKEQIQATTTINEF